MRIRQAAQQIATETPIVPVDDAAKGPGQSLTLAKVRAVYEDLCALARACSCNGHGRWPGVVKLL